MVEERSLSDRKSADGKLYRGSAKYGNGSTGIMTREKIKNGTKTSATGSHLQKAQEGLDSMRKLLKGHFGTL